MGTYTRSHSFTAGEKPTEAQWNVDIDGLITLCNGQIDKANVDSSSTDGIVTMDEAQTVTGRKAFSGNIAAELTIDTVANAAGSVQDVLTLEWDPGDGANLTDNSSGISLLYKMPDDADNQDDFAALTCMVVSDATGSEEGEFSFRLVKAGTLTEIATLAPTTGLTVGVDGTGYDVKFFGDTAGSHLLWDESADSLLLTDSTPLKIGDSQDLTLYHDGSNSYITNAVGALKIATETSGIAVTIGHTTSEVTVADNLTVTGTLTLGSGAELTEAELEFLDGITAGTVAASKAVVVDSNLDAASFRNVTLTGELDAATLDISGNADIDGTTNLDAVDIDGAVQIDATVSVGVDDQGYDVKFFGDTASAYLLWDTSADKLLTAGGASVDIVKDKLLIGGTAVTTTAAELNVLDAVTAGTVSASLGVVVDSNKDIGSFRNITLTGELDAGSLDVSGDANIAGEVQTAGIGYTDGDNAITIADGGGITAAAGITSTAASNSFGATSFGDANITNVGDIALDTISSDAGTSIGITLGTDAGDDLLVSTDKLVVEGDTGKIGIGTAAPEQAVHIQDATGSGDQFLLIEQTTNGNVDAGFMCETYPVDGSEYLQMFARNDDATQHINFSHALSIDEAGTEIAKFDAGNTILKPGDGGGLKFYAGGTGHGNYIRWSDDSGSSNQGSLGYDHSTNAMLFSTSATERMRIDSAGKVGFGVTDPDTQWEFSGTNDGGDIGLTLTNAAGSGSSDETVSLYFSHVNQSVDAGRISSIRENVYNSGAASDSGMAFYTSLNGTNTEAMRIDSSQNVGIGTGAAGDGIAANLHIVDPGTTSTRGGNILIGDGVSSGDESIELQYDMDNSNMFTLSTWNGTTETIVFNTYVGGNKLMVGPTTTGADGTLHVHTASAGSITPSSGADDLVIESSGNTGMSLLSPAANEIGIYYGDPDNAAAGRMIYNHATPDWSLWVEGSERQTTTSTYTVMQGLAFVSESANGNMSQGLTLNQSAYDNEIFALKSSDVTHVALDGFETDTFGAFAKVHATGGGLKMVGLTDDHAGNVPAFWTIAYSDDSFTDATHGATGRCMSEAWHTDHDSAGSYVTPGTGQNLSGIRVWNGSAWTTKWLVSYEGNIYADGTLTAFDGHDDVALLSAFDAAQDPSIMKGAMQAEWEDFEKYNEQTLIDLDILGGPRHGVPEEERGLINYTGLSRLTVGAVRQLGREHAQMKADFSEAIDQRDTKIALLEQRLNRLEN